MGFGGKIEVVGDNQYRLIVFFCQLRENIDCHIAVVLIQVPGRFIAYDNQGFVDQSLGYGHPLFLTTSQLVGVFQGFFFYSDDF